MLLRTLILCIGAQLPLLAIALHAAGVNEKAPQSLPLPERQTYLLLDSRVVKQTHNARLTVGTVKKHSANPLFGEDKPWEIRFDNLYANILYDQEEGIFKCWYSPFIRDVKNKAPMDQWDEISYAKELSKLKGDAERKMGICYATSKDGTRWQKPNLGLIEFDGSKANNLVFSEPHGAGIFKDLTESNAKRRYKMITGVQPHGVLSRAFSADGLHWTDLHEIAQVRGDTHNNAFWDPLHKKYVAISREIADKNRTVVRLESDNFIHWSKPKEILRGSKNDQTYAMPVFLQHQIFLGLIAVFHTQSDRVSTELAWSPDSVTWHRIDEGNALIPLAKRRGDYDWGCAFAAATPVIMPGGEIRIYYGASNGKHTSWRDGFLALATLRPDRWAGYEALDASQPATLRTVRLTCPGGTLGITADAENGEITVKLLGDKGVILATSNPLTGVLTDEPLSWTENFDLSSVKGQPISLEFNINHGRLYAFSFKK